MRKRIYAILAVWILLIAWWLRYYQTYVGSPIPGGWGVNIDWTRHAIVEQGRIVSETDSKSILSSYRGAQSYDWGAITLGIASVMIGRTLEQTLRLLNAVPVIGMIIYPAVTFIIYKRFSDDFVMLSPVGLLLLSLSLFPAVRVVFKTSLGWYPEPYSTALLLITLLMFPRVSGDKRFLFVIFVTATGMFNMYHTWVFFFILISFTVVIAEIVFRRIQTSQASPLPGILTAIVLAIIFYLTGLTLTNRFYELTSSLVSIITVGQGGFFEAADSELIGATTSQALNNIDLRRIFSLGNYVATVVAVGIFGLTRLFDPSQNNPDILADPNDRLIWFSLLSFPVIIGMFYMIGGLGTAVQRTQYVGVYFGLFCVAALLGGEHSRVKSVTIGLSILITLTAIGGVMLHSSTYTAPHTHSEADAIEFTGNNVNDDTPIFSDTQMGMPLLYYGQNSFISLQVTHDGWEERARAIYYGNTSMNRSEAIRISVQNSMKQDQYSNEMVILISKRMENDGPSLLSFQMRPAPNFIREFEKEPDYNKIYTNGESLLFHAIPSIDP